MKKKPTKAQIEKLAREMYEAEAWRGVYWDGFQERSFASTTPIILDESYKAGFRRRAEIALSR